MTPPSPCILYIDQERQQGGEFHFQMDTCATDQCEISMSL